MARKVLAALALVLLVGGGFALAAIPDSDGTIHACRKIQGGRLRAVVSASRCRADEKPLKWNVRGPQGEPGPGLTSFDGLAGLACTAGAETGTITIEYDAVTGEARIRCVVAPPPSSQVRINEFSTGVEGELTDEFVELVNAGAEPADLSGSKLVYRSASGSTDVALATLAEGTTLAPGAVFLFGGSGYAGGRAPDATFGVSLASAGGGLALRDPAGTVVDSVGWGTATNAFVEGTAAPAPSITPAPGRSDARRPDGHDTDDNGADFSEGDPTPGGAN